MLLLLCMCVNLTLQLTCWWVHNDGLVTEDVGFSVMHTAEGRLKTTSADFVWPPRTNNECAAFRFHQNNDHCEVRGEFCVPFKYPGTSKSYCGGMFAVIWNKSVVKPTLLHQTRSSVTSVRVQPAKPEYILSVASFYLSLLKHFSVYWTVSKSHWKSQKKEEWCFSVSLMQPIYASC